MLGGTVALALVAVLVTGAFRQLSGTQAYRCASDHALGGAVAAPPAGLASEVQQAFPGYRISTEREIACRWNGIIEAPGGHWAEWGSGRTWWIWSGDFDADGQDDRLVLLTRSDDPSKDMLGVLFANGRTTQAGPLGSQVIALVPAGAEFPDPESGVPIQTAGIGIERLDWSGWSELGYWDGAQFRWLETGH
ncbi:hypothetical protein BH24GEM2_BH24GEM2_00710 [soil metagenome]